MKDARVLVKLLQPACCSATLLLHTYTHTKDQIVKAAIIIGIKGKGTRPEQKPPHTFTCTNQLSEIYISILIINSRIHQRREKVSSDKIQILIRTYCSPLLSEKVGNRTSSVTYARFLIYCIEV